MTLEQSLLDIEMIGTAGGLESNKKILDDNLNQLFQYDIPIDTESNQLIQILGGFEKILQFYLSRDGLDKIQLQQINNILIQLKNKSIPKLENKNVNDDKSIMYLYKSDTLWHNMFSKSIANTITKNIMFGKYMAGIILLLSLSYVVDQILQMVMAYHIWYRFPLNLTTIIISAILLISVNKYLFKRSLFTFDFLVKTFYAIRLWICGTIYNDFSMYWSFDYWATFQAIIAISLIDGFPFPNKIKTIATLVIALNYSFFAFDWTFRPPASDTIPLFDSSFVIDNVSLIGGSYRIICLFMWKQAFRTVWYKNNSTTIRRHIKMKWLDS